MSEAGADLVLVPVDEIDEAEGADVPVHGIDTLRQALQALSAA